MATLLPPRQEPATATGEAMASHRSDPSFISHLVHVTSTPLHRVARYIGLYLRWYLAILLVLWLSTPTRADESVLNCSSITDDYVGNAQNRFQVLDWVNRGRCIRRGTDGGGPVATFQCYSRLQNVLKNNLNEIRKAEYSGAAGVLALLPTIGALLGTPTNEIWRLLTMIPFGGILAMGCSFGGAMLPVKIKDYESAFMNNNIKGALRGGQSSLAPPKDEQALDDETKRISLRATVLTERVQDKLLSESQAKVPKKYILVGLTGMSVLLATAQVAMIFVELGAVIPWWCISKWWIHLWYLMVIVSAAVDNYVQLPFSKQLRICLSDVPYDLKVYGGDSITNRIDGREKAAERIKTALPQLNTQKAGTIEFENPGQRRAEPRNVLFVHVSVTNHSHNWRKTFFQSVSKITSIAVFIVGTACFASAQLLSIAMATFVVSCVLSAGIFGRAIASWIVAGIEKADPMVHFVADTDEEAHYVLARLFSLELGGKSGSPSRRVQVELRGHIFLDGRRITSRSPWPMRILGILASPYDLAKAVYKKPRNHDTGDNAMELEAGLELENEAERLLRKGPHLAIVQTHSSTERVDSQPRRSSYASGASSAT